MKIKPFQKLLEFVVIVTAVGGMTMTTIKHIADIEPSSYNRTVGELREAREAMWRGMNSLEKLEDDLASKSASYDEIKKRLLALEKAEKLSKDELKSTLDAIGYTRQWFDLRNALLGFFIGVLSSLFANFIINKRIPFFSKTPS